MFHKQITNAAPAGCMLSRFTKPESGTTLTLMSSVQRMAVETVMAGYSQALNTTLSLQPSLAAAATEIVVCRVSRGVLPASSPSLLSVRPVASWT